MYQINDKIPTQEYRDLQVLKIIKTPKFEILCISLEGGSQFPEHTSPADAQLIVLEGAIDFHINNERFHLKKHQHFDFPRATAHRVEALENSKFLIIR
jgi:quercetin dioxygenase-like cupin family protein